MTPKSGNNPSIERIAQLQQLIADFAKVLRVLNLADNGRQENDVEHSYGLALTCWFLAPKIAPELDLGKIISYALAHDLVELYAGDTYPYGPQELIDTKTQREAAALERLKLEWPDFPQLTDAIEGYEQKKDDEALFVYAVDKILPAVIVNLHDKDAYWTEHKLTYEMHKAEKRPKLKKSKHVWPYYDRLNEWVTNPDYFYKPLKKD